MKRSTVELEIPERIIEEAQGIARRRNSSVESVLQDGLLMVFGTSADCEVSMESLRNFSDEQLWTLINHGLLGAQDSRWRELMALNKKGAMTDEESKELDDLADLLDRRILMRSKALLQMKQRGHDVDAFLGLGT